jgi:inner membrane transporter RhtA
MQLTLNAIKYCPMPATQRNVSPSASPGTAAGTPGTGGVPAGAAAPGAARRRLPPHAYFLVSAVFHYLGPALAVLLFAQIAPLGVAWLRIASAAAVFAAWRGPARLWRRWRASPARTRRLLLAFGIVLAAMNACFYLAIARVPLATVGAMEFLGPVVLAAVGVRTKRNAAAFALAVAGVALLSEVQITGEAPGLAFSLANCGLFALYIVLGHRIAAEGGGTGIDRLATAMVIAAVAITPAGIAAAAPARGGLRRRRLLVGHPVRDRSARHGPAPAGRVRAADVAAAGQRDGHRGDRAAPAAAAARDRRDCPRRRGRRAARRGRSLNPARRRYWSRAM